MNGNTKIKIQKNAINSLKRAIDKHKKINPSSFDDIETSRDSLIKRFEYSFDLTWKYIKTYLKTIYGIDTASPKKVFRESAVQKLATKQETDKLIDMVDDRNLTSHTYNENLANEVCSSIPGYYKLMSELVEKAKE